MHPGSMNKFNDEMHSLFSVIFVVFSYHHLTDLNCRFCKLALYDVFNDMANVV